ncbi:MAG TPA: TIM-barrel domain-containing protein [Acidobacteriaceae bacterium]|jgi:alpha-glucosidase|nr:TIM-barrel domain-containing protein [Acidobacteriaceae bacterium]
MRQFWLISGFVVYSALAIPPAVGEAPPASNAPFVLPAVTGFSPLQNGIDLQAGAAHEQIVALRDGVIRIRLSRAGALPEDGSWAVLQEARGSSVPVTATATNSTIGFCTKSLRVTVDRRTLELTVSDAGGNVILQDARPVSFVGDAFRIAESMPLNEHFFGLGDKTGPLDRRNEAFTLWNTDAYRFQESTDPIYKSIPFFMTYRAGVAAGILLDNTWRSNFDFGKEFRDSYTFGAENGPIDYYILYGPSPKQVVETYAWLTGKPPLPPLWSLGYQQSRYSYTPQSQVLAIAARLRADRLPVDAIYLDIDYQDHKRPFTVDKSRFPDFAGMIATLNAENFHVVAITDLHIAKYPDHGYVPYDSGMAGDDFVKNPDGTVYTGTVWPGPSVFPDFTRRQARAWWGSLYRNFYGMGIAGFWNDMNEPSVFSSPTATMPLDVVHRIEETGFASRVASHAEIHNVYGMENSRATFEGLKMLKPNLRPFVLTRATYAGGQRYAATWTGDNSSNGNHLRMTTPMLENLGISGFSFAGADVGGYAGTPTADLLTRWFEIAAFQPIDRDHTEIGTAMQEPWVSGREQGAIRRRFIETRYRLMPYLYAAAEESARTGLPIERPLFLEFPHAAPDGHPLDLDPAASAEFLFGSDLLIAPPPFSDEVDDYPVEFPSADWYDFWTGKKIPTPARGNKDAGQPVNPVDQVPLTATAHPQLDSVPVFVRGGTILPMEPLVESTNEIPRGPLTLRIYAGDPGEGGACSGSLYLDDGKTEAYRQQKYLRMHFSCEAVHDRLQVHIGAHEGSYPAWWKQIYAEVYGWKPGAAVHIEGTAKPVETVRSSQCLKFTINDEGRGLDFDLQ